MADQLDKSLRASWDHTPPRLAQASGNGGGKTPRLAAAAAPSRPPTLTEIFNHAVDPQRQIELLRRKLSRPAPTLEYGAKGSVVRGINPKRDRRIQATIEALNQMLSRTVQKTQTPKFELGQKNQITPTFNARAGIKR